MNMLKHAHFATKTRRIFGGGLLLTGILGVLIGRATAGMRIAVAAPDHQGDALSTGEEMPVSWLASPSYSNCKEPEPCCWFERNYNEIGWGSISLPQLNGVPSRQDRYYRGYFDLPVAADVQISFRSDDGLWLYLDGDLLGEQTFSLWFPGCEYVEGCFNGGNPGTRCGLNFDVAPVWRHLSAGRHVIAANLQNAVSGSYLDIRVRAALPDIEIAVAINRGDGGIYRVGDPLTMCYSVSLPVYVRFLVCPEGEACRIATQGNDDGRGDCIPGRVGGSPGRRRLVAQALSGGAGSSVVAEDEAFYQVISATPPCSDSAVLFDQSHHGTLAAGLAFDAFFEVKNTSGCAWEANAGYGLRLVDGPPFGASSWQPVNARVSNNGRVRFPLRLRAPDSPGPHEQTWRMEHNGVLFGPYMTVAFTVPDPPPPPPPPCTDAAAGTANQGGPVYPGQDVNVELTLENKGSCAWVPGTYYAETGSNSFGFPSRIELPRTVDGGSSVVVTVRGKAPATVGAYPVRWYVKHGGATLAEINATLSVIPVPPPERDSYVVFVHGWQGMSSEGHSCSKVSTPFAQGNEFGEIAKSLDSEGFDVFFVHWATNATRTSTTDEAADCINVQMAKIVEDDRDLAAKKRIIIAHSMGGLVSRRFLKWHGRPGDRLITLGTPHLGVASIETINAIRSWRLLGNVDCKRDPGTCQLTSQFVREIFNVLTPLQAGVPYDLVGGTGGSFLSAKIPGEDDGIIQLASSIGILADNSRPDRHAWRVRDTHFPWSATAKAYKDGGDSRACLAKILGVADLADESDPGAQCTSMTVVGQAADQLASLDGVASYQQATGEPVAGKSAAGRVSPNDVEMVDLPVDGRQLTAILSWRDGELVPRWVLPSGEALTGDEVVARFPGSEVAEGSFEEVKLVSLTIAKPTPGLWKVRLEETAGQPTPFSITSFLQSDVHLDVEAPSIVRERDRFTLSAVVRDGADSLDTASVVATWVLDGREYVQPMPWSTASRRFETPVVAPVGAPGIAIRVVAKGSSLQQVTFERTADIMVAVPAPELLPELPVGRTGRVFFPLLSRAHRLNCLTQEIEPNDSRADADGRLGLCTGQPVRGQLWPGDPWDAYLVEIDRPMMLDAELLPDPSSGDIDLYLFRERDVDFLAKSENVGAAAERIRVALSPGRYYLMAFPAGGQTVSANYSIVWREAP